MKWITTILTLMLLTGCNDKTDVSGLQSQLTTQAAQITALQNQLTALQGSSDTVTSQVTDLQANLEKHVDRVMISPGTPVSFAPRAIAFSSPHPLGATSVQLQATPTSSIGTFSGFLNDAGTETRLKLDTGYFGIFESAPDSSGNPITYLKETIDAYYTSNDCGMAGGDAPYLINTQVGASFLQSGEAIRLPNREATGTTLNDPSDFWAVAPGTAQASVDVVSQLRGDANCVILAPDGSGGGTPITINAIALVPNDYAVTGAPNGAWSGTPVLTGI